MPNLPTFTNNRKATLEEQLESAEKLSTQPKLRSALLGPPPEQRSLDDIINTQKEKIQDVGNVLSEPGEYDELDTSGYLPNQQLAGQGAWKAIRAALALQPKEEEMLTIGNDPVTGKPMRFDPTVISGLKNVSKLVDLANIKSPLKPNQKIKELASEYSKSKGLQASDIPSVKPDPIRGKLIANAFEKMKHDPNNPEVKKAYDALAQETLDQYKKIKETGFTPIKMTPGMENPYRAGSKDLLKDIKENNRMYYYPTEQGFGSNQVISESPMLQKSGEVIGGEEVPVNDVFRIVHDYFGHGSEGHGFGPMGEENAWLKHSQMYSPEARKALTTETRGQNSWVNYGPHGEVNRANPANTVYADQKIGLLPDWVVDIPEVRQQDSDLLKRIYGTSESYKNFPGITNSLKDKETD